MKAKLLAIAIATLTAAHAQESPVVTPLDPDPTTTPQLPTTTEDPAPLTDPNLEPTDPQPAPTFSIQSTDNYHLDQTITRARQLATAGQLAEAGGLLFHAAAAVEALSDPTRRDVSESVASLRVLAFDIASHNVITPTQFRDAATAAHLSLATEQVLQARGAWNERRSVATGQALTLASFHLDRSIAWGDRAPSPVGTTTLATANHVGAALTAPDPLNPVSPAAVQASIDSIAKMTATVGRTFVEARGKDGLDERITQASRTALEGIKKGTRKAAEKLGDRLQRLGTALQAD